LFALFAAPPNRDLEWIESGVEGCSRFLSRVWRTFHNIRDRLPPLGAESSTTDDPEARALRGKTHRTIVRVTDGLGPRMSLNTAVAAIMELTNAASSAVDKVANVDSDDNGAGGEALFALRECFEVTARLLAPFAPHFAEELWERLGHSGFVALAPWPQPDPAFLIDEQAIVVVQVNGKLRARLSLERGADEATALAAARSEPNVAPHVDRKTVVRVVWVPDRLLNLVVR
jgi:leucyl-tRNA synthetase